MLARLDSESYFTLLGLPMPERPAGILAALEQDRLISPDVGGRWNISNLGAILLASNLHDFGPHLARKAARFVVYEGDGRTAAVTHRHDFVCGYANGFEALNEHVNVRLPAREDGESLMRRFGLCEELGTGVDKVIAAAELERLPPPEFRAEESATRAILYGPRRFAEMTSGERQRACYQHTVLRYLDGSRMRNATLRQRFGVAEHNAAQISGVIRHALRADLIRPADPVRPRSGYVPFWA